MVIIYVVLFQDYINDKFKRLQYDNRRDAWNEYSKLKEQTKQYAWDYRNEHAAGWLVNEMDSANTENGKVVYAGYTVEVVNPCTYTRKCVNQYVEFAERPDWWPEDEPGE